MHSSPIHAFVPLSFPLLPNLTPDLSHPTSHQTPPHIVSPTMSQENFVMRPEDGTSAIAAGEKLSLIYQFTAEWCKPCKAIAPLIGEQAAKHKIVVLKIDVDNDDFESLMRMEGFTSDADELLASVSQMPTFVAVNRGVVVARMTGTNTTEVKAFFKSFSDSMKVPDEEQSTADAEGESKAAEPAAVETTQAEDEEEEDPLAPTPAEEDREGGDSGNEGDSEDEPDDEEEGETEDETDEEDSYYEEKQFGLVPVMPNPNLVAGASFVKLGKGYVSVAALVHAHGIAPDGALLLPGGVAIETDAAPDEVAAMLNHFMQEVLTPEEYIALVSNK